MVLASVLSAGLPSITPSTATIVSAHSIGMISNFISESCSALHGLSTGRVSLHSYGQILSD